MVWFLAAHIFVYSSVNTCRHSSPHLWWLSFGILCILYLMLLEIFLLGLLIFILGPILYVSTRLSECVADGDLCASIRLYSSSTTSSSSASVVIHYNTPGKSMRTLKRYQSPLSTKFPWCYTSLPHLQKTNRSPKVQHRRSPYRPQPISTLQTHLRLLLRLPNPRLQSVNEDSGLHSSVARNQETTPRMERAIKVNQGIQMGRLTRGKMLGFLGTILL